MLWVAIILFIAALVAGMPVVFALGLSGVVALFVASDLPLMLVPQRIVGTIDSFWNIWINSRGCLSHRVYTNTSNDQERVQTRICGCNPVGGGDHGSNCSTE
jgi:hypothetical protein